MRKQAFLHADQEHQRKLESLDRMHRHQLHAILPGVGLALARFQRGMREKRIQRGHILFDQRIVLKVLAGADQFLQVLDARLPFLAAVLFEMRFESAHFDTELDLFAER